MSLHQDTFDHNTGHKATISGCCLAFLVYTRARKDYIHKFLFVFGINFPKNYISITRTYFSGINFPKIAYHVFVCDSENYMENCLGIIVLENLISVT